MQLVRDFGVAKALGGFGPQTRTGIIKGKLAYMAPALQNTGSVVCEPVDVAIPKRHLHITASAIRNSDKSFMGPVTHPDRAADAVRMCEIVFGEQFVHDNAVMVGLVNGNSPLVWDATMIGALRVYARSGQALVVAPFTLAGANTPASATATVAELRAERDAMFGGQGLFGRDRAARRPFARHDARSHGRGQCAVAALPGFGFDKANG